MSKKKETIDELVEEALVLEEKQPYVIPKNWMWIKLLSGYAECLDKYRKPVNANERAKRVGNIPYYGATGQVGWIDEYLTNEELVLLGEDGVSFLDPFRNKAYMIRGKAWVNNHAHILKSNFGKEGNLFLLHYLNQFNFNGYVSGTTRLKLTQKQMANIPVPLPPLSEQKRIAEKVERLLKKVEEARQLIEEARETFELRRASILDKAFRGELTSKWRKENKPKLQIELNCDYLKNHDIENDLYSHMNIPETWKWIRAENLFSIQPRNGYSPKSTMSVTNTKTIKLGAITKGYFIDDEYKYIEENIEKDSYLWLKKGDFLIQRANSIDYVGTAAIYTGQDDEFVYPDLIMKGRLKEEFVCPEFMVLWINSHLGKKFIKQNATGTAGNMPKINQKVVKSIPMPIPPIQEQKEILRIYNETTRRELQLKINNAYEMIDKIKQSILSKAFRGELGTNDPSEENAIELLKEILQEQVK
ncbi:hypothetical protein ACS52_24535 [Bacillus cereus]|nr:hypothetical protein ACS52_24535 [Bacillus cereus]